MGNAKVLMAEVAQNGNVHMAISMAFHPGFTERVSQARKIANPLLIWFFSGNK